MRRSRIKPTASFMVVSALLASLAGTAHAESVKFSVSIPKVYEEWMRDEPKHVNHLTIKPFAASVEYVTRVVNVETGEVVPSGSNVPLGTQLKFEFLPESMSWHATGNIYDTPYAYWTTSLPPAPSCDVADRVINQTGRKFNGRNSGNNIYAPVYAEPPAKTVRNATTLGSCTAPAGDGDTTCTASNIGTHTVSFDFAQSRAQQYVRIYRMDVSRDAPPANRWPRLNVCEPMGNLSNIRDFAGAARNEPRSTIALPQKSVPFSVTVMQGEGEEPIQPQLSASSGAACVMGTPYTIAMTATDPDGDQIRYLVDWNDDGNVDQFVPAADYVPSGTTLAASRTYATAGAKIVRVRVQDEEGMLSEWATLSFSCAESTETAGLVGENEWTGVAGNAGGSAPSANDLTLRVLPSLVRPGNTTRVHWSSQNMSACTVSGTNGDSWSGLASPVSGEISRAINGQVKYTLTCLADGDTFTKSATVNVLPSWTER